MLCQFGNVKSDCQSSWSYIDFSPHASDIVCACFTEVIACQTVTIGRLVSFVWYDHGVKTF